jgi:hypothetical protein
MSSKQERFRIAVLDDYQQVALSLADWSVLDARATVTVFNDHVADSDAVVERLQPFDIVCVMRERTPMTRTIIERLHKLRLSPRREPGMPRSISKLQKSGACKSFIRATPRRQRSS